MRKPAELAVFAFLALLLCPQRFLAQDKDPDIGSVEFGVRFATGDVYGRPDLPFSPALKTSEFNEYQDIRDGFYIRRVDVRFDNVLHTQNYFAFQSASTLYRDQSYLANLRQLRKIQAAVPLRRNPTHL